jgi:hypothetical protein
MVSSPPRSSNTTHRSRIPGPSLGQESQPCQDLAGNQSEADTWQSCHRRRLPNLALYHFTYIRRPSCNNTALPGTLRQSAASLGTGVDAARLARVLAIDLQGGAHVVPVGSLSGTSVGASWGEDMDRLASCLLRPCTFRAKVLAFYLTFSLVLVEKSFKSTFRLRYWLKGLGSPVKRAGSEMMLCRPRRCAISASILLL